MSVKTVRYDDSSWIITSDSGKKNNNIYTSINSVDVSRFDELVDTVEKKIDDDVQDLMFRMNLLKKNRKRNYAYHLKHDKNWKRL